MPLILNIDTATEKASVCISENGDALSYRENNLQKEHASFVHTAIQSMLEETGKKLHNMHAVAVTSGPGSYTGLRVGLATAKGFCYALKIPLITINTLNVMAQAAINEHPASLPGENLLYCPMIDARRMEVYTALLNSNMEFILGPVALVLEEHCLDGWLNNNPILFFGSGSEKLKTTITHKNVRLANISHSSVHLAKLAHQHYTHELFADVAYAEPEYLKEFYSPKTQ